VYNVFFVELLRILILKELPVLVSISIPLAPVLREHLLYEQLVTVALRRSSMALWCGQIGEKRLRCQLAFYLVALETRLAVPSAMIQG